MGRERRDHAAVNRVARGHKGRMQEAMSAPTSIAVLEFDVPAQSGKAIESIHKAAGLVA